jgi:hypothetical protein
MLVKADGEKGQTGRAMRCLTTAECEQMVQLLDLRIEGQRLRSINGRSPASQELKIPDSARRQALGVNVLFRALPDDTSEWLLWVLECGAWPDEEYPELWYEIREHHGESRPILEAPGHLFAQSEIGLARGMTRLAMLFGWTAFLVPKPVSLAARLDKADLMELSASSAAAVAAIGAEITELWTKPW